MTYWRKQQMGHRGSSSSFNRKPPLPLDTSMRPSTLPSWEKKFFHSVCSISWKKFVENQRYTQTHDKVMKWEDSAVKEAFDSAKMRFWAELNKLSCGLPLPDPDIYIDKVDWDAIVDPKLFEDLEKEELPSEEKRSDGVVILGTSLLLNHTYSGGGWGGLGWGDDDEEEEATKPAEAAQGWESNLQENIETNSWEQHYVPFEYPKETDEWKNESNLYQNNETNSWEEQHYAPVKHAKEYGVWKNEPNNETNSWEQQHYAPVEHAKEYDVWKNEPNNETNSWEEQHYAPVEHAKEYDVLKNESNNETNSWEKQYAPFEYAKAYYEGQNGQNDYQRWNQTEEYSEWQNGQKGYQGWIEREKYGGGCFHNNKGRGRNGWNENGNWGAGWDGNNRRRENMTWSRNSGGYYGNEYQMNQMNRGRRNNRGGGRGRGRGRRGNFGYVPAAAAGGAW